MLIELSLRFAKQWLFRGIHMSKIYTVKMPDIGEGVVEGEVVDWLKKVNETVSQDEPVVVVMTDKATVELPSPYPGKIIKHYFQIGQTAVKDKPLYDIELAEEVKVTTSIHEEGISIKKEEPVQRSQPVAPEPQITREGGTALAAPYVRKMARDLGIEIDQVQASGKEGNVTEEDLRRYIAAQKSEAVKIKTPAKELAGDEEMPLVGVRHFMVKKMAESHENIPPFSYFEQVDASRLVQLREKIKEEAIKEKIHLTYMPFFIRALSLTIHHFPTINSSLDSSGNKLIVHKQQNIGIAIATSTGLIVPVLKGVQDLKFEELIRQYDGLKRKALDNKLQPQDMKEATITISNYGVLGGGGLWATPIINFPEVAILAVARIQKQPMAKNNEVVIRDVLDMSWSFDHRVIDGDLGASVSQYFSQLIKNPAQLL